MTDAFDDFDEQDRDRETRRKMLEALAKSGITPDMLAENYMALVTLNKAEGNSKEMRLLLKDVTELLGAAPRKRTSVKVQSDQRILSLTVGEGSAGGLSAAELRKLPAEDRRQYLALQSRARTNDTTEPTTRRLMEGNNGDPSAD